MFFLNENSDLQDTFLRPCEQCVAGVVYSNLYNGICWTNTHTNVDTQCLNYIHYKFENVFFFLTIFRERELKHGGDEERQGAFGVVDFPAALTQPASLGLVGYLVQAPVLPCHEDAAQVCGSDGEDVGVVCGDGEERVRQQLQPTGHAVVQTWRWDPETVAYMWLIYVLFKYYKHCCFMKYLFINIFILQLLQQHRQVVLPYVSTKTLASHFSFWTTVLKMFTVTSQP